MDCAMADGNTSTRTGLSTNGAISLARAVGIACTLVGLAMIGYITNQIDGSRWVQFAWLLILFFGISGGFVVLSEFTPKAFLNLPAVQWASHNLKWGLQSVCAISVLGLLVIPKWVVPLPKYLFIIPGPTLIGIALLQKHALQNKVRD